VGAVYDRALFLKVWSNACSSGAYGEAAEAELRIHTLAGVFHHDLHSLPSADVGQSAVT
jgi:hypothetical protein